MDNCRCSVVAKEFRDDLRIRKAIAETHHNDQQCQFSNYLKAEYEYKGENFCILHLPFVEKNTKNLFGLAEDAFANMLQKNITNFQFISAAAININNLEKIHHLSFQGSYIWTLNIKNTQIECLSLSRCNIRGRTVIENCDINRIHILDSDASCYFSFQECKISLFLCMRSKFYFSEDTLRLDSANYSIQFKKSQIETFRFKENHCELSLKFDFANISEIDLTDTNFMLCPSFFNTDFADKNKELSLPKKESYSLKKLLEPYSLWNKKHLKLLIQPKQLKQFFNKHKNKIRGRNHALRDQYLKFREIYNLTKRRGMYIEQGEYFCLMQKCLLKDTSVSLSYRIFSALYGCFSGYGQSLFKPLFWLVVVWFISGFCYALPKAIDLNKPFLKNLSHIMGNLSGPLLTSFKQILKPYELIFSNQTGWLTTLIAATESTLAVALIASFILALRWNYRKA